MIEPHLIQEIMLREAQGASITQISKALRVSRPTIYRIILSYEIFGQPYPPRSHWVGRPRLCLPYQELVGVLL
jgi:transposase